jgi:hypothetical protein
MPDPSKAAQENAAKRLAHMAHAGLAGGRALFRGDELERVEWFKTTWRTDFRRSGDLEVSVPPPFAFESEEELLDACRVEIEDALYNRGDLYKAEMAGLFEFYRRSHDDPKYDSAEIMRRLQSMAGWLHDDEAERDWRARLAEVEA